LRRGRSLLGVVLTGCAAHSSFDTAKEAPPPPRQPDGVVLEAEPSLPDLAGRAPARGVVALREPRDPAPFRELAYAYVHALQREDLDSVIALLTTDAVALHGKARPTRSALLESLRSRMRAVDYTQIAGLDPLEGDAIRIYDYDELGAAGELARPPEMRTGEVLVRAPVAVARIGSDRFFGAALLLVVRREDARLRIAGIGEDDGR
jgi:hypothetical protein